MKTFLIALLCVLVTGVAVAGDVALLARPAMQTPAPTGRVVVLLASTTDLTTDDAGLVGRSADVVRLQRLVAGLAGGARIERRFAIPAAAATGLAATARQRTGRPAPDLNRYAMFDAGTRDLVRLRTIVATVAADPAVATAFAEPVAVPAALGFDAFTGATPPAAAVGAEPAVLPSPDYSAMQGYLEDAPTGIGALTMASQPGARGGSMQVVDVEGAWLWTHEDLPSPVFTAGTPFEDLSWRNHGTAVMGEMRGNDDFSGVRGIVPSCAVGGSSIGSQSTADAIIAAAAANEPGDAILIELHAPGPNASGSGQFGYVAMEFWQDNFDAIQLATGLGLIVCEAAGNGSQNYDDPIYGDLFDRTFRDSGAIMIGATVGASLDPAWFSNNGTRVDCNGWGLDVTTCAYGDLQGGDETMWYTSGFSGTSSASPIVTGAVLSLQGMVKTQYGIPMDAYLARAILSSTGTPTNGSTLIGTRPDLVAAWSLASAGIGTVAGAVFDDAAQPLEGVTISVSPGDAVAVTAADGSYQIPLLAGSYALHFHDFYHADVDADVVIATGATPLDVTMDLLPLVAVSGQVTDVDGGGLGGAVITPLGVPLSPVTCAADGSYVLSGLPAGVAFSLVAGSVPGYGGVARDISLPASPGSVTVDLELPAATYTFESDAQGFTANSLWTRGDPMATHAGPGNAFDGNNCWGVGMDGAGYPDNSIGTLSSPDFTADDFDGYANLFLSFHYWLGSEATYDGFNVVIASPTPEVVTPVGGYSDASLAGLVYQPGWSGDSGGWRTAVFDLSAYLGTDFSVRFVFGSDEAVTETGVFIDGVTLAPRMTVTPVPDGGVSPAPAIAAVQAFPNPFNPQTTLRWALPHAGRGSLCVYDLRGQLVRTLLADASVPASGTLTWDGTDDHGRSIASGVYLVRLRGDAGAVATQRVVMAK